MNKLFLSLLFIFAVLIILPLKAHSEEINWIPGPKTIEVVDNSISIYVPRGFVFADKEDAKKFMRKHFIPTTKDDVGIILSADDTQFWFILFQYKDIGYVEENLLVDMDPEGFIKGMKMKQKTQSISTGINPFMTTVEIEGFREEPVFDKQLKQLKATINVKQGKKQPKTLINYLTMAFGRNGVLTARLVCDEEEYTYLKKDVDSIYEKLFFNNGYKYSDFDSSTDEYAFSGGAGDLLLYLTGSSPKKTKASKIKKTSGSAKSTTANTNTPVVEPIKGVSFLNWITIGLFIFAVIFVVIKVASKL